MVIWAYSFLSWVVGLNLLFVSICLLPPVQMVLANFIYWSVVLSIQGLLYFFTGNKRRKS